MTEREWNGVLGGILVAYEVIAILALQGSDLHLILQTLIVLLPIGALIAFLVSRAKWRHRRGERQEAPAKRHLSDLFKANGNIEPGWFVSFTSGPYSTTSDPAGRCATAIAEVMTVDEDNVEVTWRDRAGLPTIIPIALLDANRVVRVHGGRRVQTDNGGLRVSNGGSVTGPGWNAHRDTPSGFAWVRWADLGEDGRRAMEADADLASYEVP